MRAIVMREFGDPEVLHEETLPDPKPGAGEVLVRVGAVAVSATRDLATRTGKHPFSQFVSLPHVLGGDCAGVVEAAGEGVPADTVGQRVAVSNTQTCGRCPACMQGRRAQCLDLKLLGIHLQGSYAELVSVPTANVRAIPDDLSLEEAAALAANGPVALTQLRATSLRPGDRLMVPGATGALGSILVCVGDALGARVVALSRRPDDLPDGLPTAARLDSSRDDLADLILGQSEGHGVDVVADNVSSGRLFSAYYAALAVGGRVVVSGAIGSDEHTRISIPGRSLYLKSQSVLGVRTTSVEDIRDFWDLVDEGFRLVPGLVQARPLEEAALVHHALSAGGHVGTMVLDTGLGTGVRP